MPWGSLSACLLCSHTWPKSSPSILDTMPYPTPSAHGLPPRYTTEREELWFGCRHPMMEMSLQSKLSLRWKLRQISGEICPSHAMVPCGHLRKAPLCFWGTPTRYLCKEDLADLTHTEIELREVVALLARISDVASDCDEVWNPVLERGS